MNVAPRLDLVRTPSEQRSRHREARAAFFPPPPSKPRVIEIIEPSAADTTLPIIYLEQQQLPPPSEPTFPSIASIKTAICRKFQLSPICLESIRHAPVEARPRQIVMYLARTLTPLSFPKIAEELRRDHTTIMHGYRKIMSLRQTDTILDQALKELEAELAPKDAPR